MSRTAASAFWSEMCDSQLERSTSTSVDIQPVTTSPTSPAMAESIITFLLNSAGSMST